MDQEVIRLEKEAAHLQEQEELWAERARRAYSADEGKALSCVARMTQVQAACRQVQSDLKEVKSLRQKMARDVDHILKKMEALKRKHQNLAGRQACAEAVHALHSVDGGIQNDIDNLFSRWETDIVTQELHSQTATDSCDLLAEEFETSEQQEALRMTLAQIISSSSEKKENSQ